MKARGDADVVATCIGFMVTAVIMTAIVITRCDSIESCSAACGGRLKKYTEVMLPMTTRLVPICECMEARTP